MLGTLVGIRILTELMSPAEYGQLALGLTAATLASQVLWGPLSGGRIGKAPGPSDTRSE